MANNHQKTGIIIMALVCGIVTALGCAAPVRSAGPHPAVDAYDGWRLGVQAWSFRQFTFFEAVDKTRELGLSWIQAYPGQKIAPDIDAVLNWELSDELRQKVKDKLAEANVAMVAFGVVGIPKDQAEARKLFAFAKEMGVEMIASEPEFDQFDLIDKLAQEYQIKVGIHNHPKQSRHSRYWDPAIVLDVIKNRSPWLGACADVGHWARSGLNPVECLKQLEGRIHDVHIKEVDLELGHDVVWGQGQSRTRGILEELHRQGYQGTFAIEYEHSWDNNVPLIRESIVHYNAVVASLNPSGWRPLFEADLSNAEVKPETWRVGEEGTLKYVGGGDVWTKQQYGDFVLDFEYKVDAGANSGVFLRTGDYNWLPWPEVQIADSYGKDVSRRMCGAIYDIQAPSVNAVRPTGQWNRMTIYAHGSKIRVALNNHRIIDMNLDDWKEVGKNPDGSTNKFKMPYKDMPRKGFIGFQGYRDNIAVWYRNLNIKEL